MNYKRILAVGLAASMVMGSSVVAFAAEGNGTGSGSLDIVDKSDVFNVVLPTDAGTTFDYILDPTGVIKETDASKYGGADFAEGDTLYFANVTKATTEGADDTVAYSKTSDAIKAVNKSTMDVEIKVNAKVAAVQGITMSSDDTFGAGTETAAEGDDETADTKAAPMLYLAVKDADGATPITTTGIDVTKTIAADTAAYETTWNATDKKYEKTLTEAAQKADYEGFKSYSFQLTGACNKDGDWSKFKDTPPEVEVVWSIEDTTVTGPQITLSTNGKINITNFDGTLFGSMSLNDGTQDWPLVTGTDGTWEWGDAVDAKKEFTLASNWMPSYLAGKTATVTLTLTDGSTISSAPVTFPAE